MERTLYDEDHEAYRETVREFLAREVIPHKDQWDDDKWIPREVFKAAADAGLYALQIPEEYGGSGVTDYRYRLVVSEEVARANAISFGVTLGLQDDLFLAYLLGLAIRLMRLPGMRSWALTLVILTVTQVTLGILNVKLGLPLHVAVAHNAGAALLLFTLVSLLARLRRPE